jgi:hypothetical protein
MAKKVMAAFNPNNLKAYFIESYDKLFTCDAGSL